MATCNESEITSGFRQLVQTIMTYICALIELRVEEQTLAKFYRALTHKIYDLLDKVRFNFLEIFLSPISLRICDLLTFVFVFALLTQRFLFILFSNADHTFVGQFNKLCIKWWFLSKVFYRHLRIIYFNLKIIYFIYSFIRVILGVIPRLYFVFVGKRSSCNLMFVVGNSISDTMIVSMTLC